MVKTGGHTTTPTPTFGQCLVAKDQDYSNKAVVFTV